MPISFAFDGDDVNWLQQFRRPAVYLDTFAIRAISQSNELSLRFAQGIKSRNGTWLLAALSMDEFASFADARHADQAERLLALVVPHIYLFLAEPIEAREAMGNVDLAARTVPRAHRRNMDFSPAAGLKRNPFRRHSTGCSRWFMRCETRCPEN